MSKIKDINKCSVCSKEKKIIFWIIGDRSNYFSKKYCLKHYFLYFKRFIEKKIKFIQKHVILTHGDYQNFYALKKDVKILFFYKKFLRLCYIKWIWKRRLEKDFDYWIDKVRQKEIPIEEMWKRWIIKNQS